MKRLILMAVISAAVLSSCGKQEGKKPDAGADDVKKTGTAEGAGKQDPLSEGDIVYDSGRKLYRIDRQDLNGDKRQELIALSYREGAESEFQGGHKFDMIEVFYADSSSGKFVKKLRDTVDFAVDAGYYDLSSDGKKQILVTTNSGGNNIIASEGMYIYQMSDDGSMNLLKFFDGGSPKVVMLEEGRPAVIVNDLFHGVMPMADAVPYTSEILELRGNEMRLCNTEHPEYFQQKIDSVLDTYYGMKRKFEMGMQPGNLSYPLYREAAEVVVNYVAKGDIDGLRKFWDQEKSSLERNIPREEFIDLRNLVNKALPLSPNA